MRNQLLLEQIARAVIQKAEKLADAVPELTSADRDKNLADMLEDEQMRAAGALVPFAGEAQLTVSSPFALDGEEKVPPRRAPSLGQHSTNVLHDAGYSYADIDRLRDLGVVA